SLTVGRISNPSPKETGRISNPSCGKQFPDPPSRSLSDGAVERRSDVENPHAAELLIPSLQELIQGYRAQLAQIAQQVRLEGRSRLPVVAVGAAERFGNDVIDDPQGSQMTGGQAQGIGGQGLGLLVGLLPKDARTALGADYRIPGVFQQADAI